MAGVRWREMGQDVRIAALGHGVRLSMGRVLERPRREARTATVAKVGLNRYGCLADARILCVAAIPGETNTLDASALPRAEFEMECGKGSKVFENIAKHGTRIDHPFNI